MKENLKAAKLQSENFTYEIVKDIAVKGAFDDALKKHPEVTVFLHTASPFHFNVTDIEKLLTQLLKVPTMPYKPLKHMDHKLNVLLSLHHMLLWEDLLI